MEIRYVTGDATDPPLETPAIVVHVCNDIGAWGRGFVLALSKRYPEAERCYRAWSHSQEDIPFALGEVQFVQGKPNLWIANLIGQHDIRKRGGFAPVRYEAIREGLVKVAAFARKVGASVHMPRIGCGLAGGTWEEIVPIVEAELTAKGVAVTVYDLPT